MRFRLLTPPASEPVTTADLMAFARVDTDPDDGVLARVLTAARERVERDAGLALITQTWVASLDRWPPAFPGGGRSIDADEGLASGWQDAPATVHLASDVIEIVRRPVQSIVSLAVRDAAAALQSVDASTYFVEVSDGIGRIIRKPGAAWPLAVAGMPDAIEINVRLGFGDAGSSVPAELQTAILMLASHWYETREPVVDGRSAAVPEHVRSILQSWQGRRLR